MSIENVSILPYVEQDDQSNTGVSHKPLMVQVSYGNFKLQKTMLPVDLMVTNPKLYSFLVPKIDWYLTNLMQMVPGFRRILMIKM